jgi:hypothetical protein
MSDMDLITVAEMMRDYFAPPGTRLKQYVVDKRREHAWELETCPKVTMAEHDDNTGLSCRNTYVPVPWTYLDHDCCDVCGDEHEKLRSRDDVQAWLAEKEKRPPICADRSKLSDEIQPDYAATPHPLLRRR